MKLDVAADGATDHGDQLVDLRRRRHPDGVGQADPVDAGAVDRALDAQQILGIGAEGVLRADLASRPAPRISATTALPISMISSMFKPCEAVRRREEVAISTSTPSTPVSIASLASSRLQRTWVRSRKPRSVAAIRRRSASDLGDATGDVSSM